MNILPVPLKQASENFTITLVQKPNFYVRFVSSCSHNAYRNKLLQNQLSSS